MPAPTTTISAFSVFIWHSKEWEPPSDPASSVRLKIVDLGTAGQIRLEVEGRRCSLALDRKDDRTHGALAGNRLRSLVSGSLDHVVEPPSRLFDLPRCHGH